MRRLIDWWMRQHDTVEPQKRFLVFLIEAVCLIVLPLLLIEIMRIN